MAITLETKTYPSYTKTTYIVDPLQTTNATVTVGYTIPIATNKAAYTRVEFVANNTAYTNAVGGVAQAVFFRASGNLSRTSTPDSQGLISTLLSNFAITPRVNIVANTANQSIEVRVTGVAATTINWHLEITNYLSND